MPHDLQADPRILRGDLAHAGTNLLLSASYLFSEAITEDDGVTPHALMRHDLDQLDTTRPIRVSHWHGHRYWVNTKRRHHGSDAGFGRPERLLGC